MATIAARPSAAPRINVSLRDRATPDILKLAIGASWLLVLVLFLIAFSAVNDIRAAAQTIGKDSEPSVVAARQIGLSLANMHASVANALLVGPGKDADSWATYAQEQKTVADTLVDAAQNITYPGEKDQIRILNETFVRYQDLVSTAAASEAQTNASAALKTFAQADDLIHARLIPAATELARINDDALTQSYNAHRSTGIAMAIVTVIAGLAVLAILVSTQMFLSRKTHRTLNAPLLLASLVILALVALTARTLASANEDLRSAKQDAYDSVYALTSARAVSYDANADESLWLLASDDQRYETSFMTKTKQISDPWLTDTQAQQLAQLVNRHQQVPFKGYLANELNNITFPGEREAALAASSYWARYLAIDGQIRSLDRSGDHAGAIALDIGNAQDQSDWAFNNYDKSMAQLIDINQTAFDDSIQQVFSEVGIAPILPILALLAAGLVWFGLQPRIAEYR
jgi:hypothetical protein